MREVSDIIISAASVIQMDALLVILVLFFMKECARHVDRFMEVDAQAVTTRHASHASTTIAARME